MLNDWHVCVHFSSLLINASLNQILANFYELTKIPLTSLVCGLFFNIYNGLLIMPQEISDLFCQNLNLFLCVMPSIPSNICV